MSTKRIIFDIDDTITIHSSSKDYKDKLPRLDIIQKISTFRKLGYEIILFSARNMNSYSGDLSKININTLPILLDWLKKHNVEYDGILMGKPWCGEDGFYVDDKAIRPSEFLKLTEQEIQQLLKQ